MIECNLREHREKHRLTVQELAKAAHLAHPTITKYEKGVSEPRIHNAYKIAALLDCSVEDLWPNRVKVRSETVTVTRKVLDEDV